MKVLLLSTRDISGGAAISAYRLFQRLKKEMQDAQMYVMYKHEDENNIATIPDAKYNVVQKVRKKIKYWKIKNAKENIDKIANVEKFSFEYSPYYWQNIKQDLSFDLLNIHWVNGCIDFKGIHELANGKPVIFTLHDMAHFTGGCHYSKACRNFEVKCGHCPIIDSAREHDISRYNWKQKERYIRQMNATVVTPSRWLAQEASKSSLLGGLDIHVIPNGINTNFFRPDDDINRDQFRNIPDEKILLLTGALDLSLERKGVDLLAKALKNLSPYMKEKISLLSFGKGEVRIPGVETISLGYLTGKNLVNAYNLADLFVIPSRQDNLPNTVIEALACGTPAMGFNIGGIPDMVKHKKNGYLVRPYDTLELAEQITAYVENTDETRVNLGKNARHTALESYTLERQAKKYDELFQILT